MSEPITVTPEMVLQVTPVKPSAAARIAEYAALRIGGKLLADACREVGVTDQTARHYEKVLPALCDRFGLPTPYAHDHRQWGPQGPRGAHARWHVGRGVVSPDCVLCQESAS